MKCKDLVKIIQDLKLEDYEIFGISLDYTFKTGDISIGTNLKTLPYPQYRDIFTFGAAESYDHVSITVDMDNGTVLDRYDDHFDTSSEKQYPY